MSGMRESADLGLELIDASREARTVTAQLAVATLADQLAEYVAGLNVEAGSEGVRDQVVGLAQQVAANAVAIAARWSGGRA